MAELTWARAHTNIALVKYWGKADSNLMLPQNSSLSLTLDHFYTDTSVQFIPDLSSDTFQLDGQSLPVAVKVTRVLDRIRELAGIQTFARVTSFNHVPTAAGLASSAAAFAALAAAGANAAGLTLSDADLSRLARLGSGSATRSIFGGFAKWHAGDSDATSFASVVQDPVAMDIRMVTVIVDDHQKQVSSTSGMQSSVQTSPYYPAWRKQAQSDLVRIERAIVETDFATLGSIAETNAMRMHALTLSADPSFTYFTGESIQAMQLVQRLRQSGVPAYFTMDAGPNVKVLCPAAAVEPVVSALADHFAKEAIIVCKPGPGVKIYRGPLQEGK